MGSDGCHATSVTSSKWPRSAPRRFHFLYSADSTAAAPAELRAIMGDEGASLDGDEGELGVAGLEDE